MQKEVVCVLAVNAWTPGMTIRVETSIPSNIRMLIQPISNLSRCVSFCFAASFGGANTTMDYRTL